MKPGTPAVKALALMAAIVLAGIALILMLNSADDPETSGIAEDSGASAREKNVAEATRNPEKDQENILQANIAEAIPDGDNNNPDFLMKARAFVRYEEMKRNFEQDAAAFRARNPVYGEAVDVFKKEVLPLMLRCELASRSITGNTQNQAVDEEAYDGPNNETFAYGTIAELYLDIIEELTTVAAAEGVDLFSLMVQNEKVSLSAMVRHLEQDKYQEAELDPDRIFNGHEETRNTFERNLGEALALYSYMIRNAALLLPPDLANRNEELALLHKALVAEGIVELDDLSDHEYLEPYARLFLAIEAQYTEELMQMQNAELEPDKTASLQTPDFLTSLN